MSATTISAVLGRLGGVSAHYNRYGELESAQAFDDLDERLGGVTLDADHNHERLGEVAYVEISPQGWLGLVGVVAGDWLIEAERERPVFVSGEFEMRNRSSAGATYIAGLATLRSAAVTWEPARLDARPARLRPGDVRQPADRRNWPITWGSHDPLLKRAVDHGSWATDVPRVVDLRDNGHNPLGLNPGDPAPSGYLRSNDLPGGLRRGPPGRILSIR
jgi:hypothetical protein